MDTSLASRLKIGDIVTNSCPKESICIFQILGFSPLGGPVKVHNLYKNCSLYYVPCKTIGTYRIRPRLLFRTTYNYLNKYTIKVTRKK